MNNPEFDYRLVAKTSVILLTIVMCMMSYYKLRTIEKGDLVKYVITPYFYRGKDYYRLDRLFNVKVLFIRFWKFDKTLASSNDLGDIIKYMKEHDLMR
jgi:hypothetical protein